MHTLVLLLVALAAQAQQQPVSCKVGFYAPKGALSAAQCLPLHCPAGTWLLAREANETLSGGTAMAPCCASGCCGAAGGPPCSSTAPYCVTGCSKDPGPGCAPNCCTPNCQTKCQANCTQRGANDPIGSSCGVAAITTCLGCPPGTHGTVGAPPAFSCAACPAGRVCMGLLDSPLYDFGAGVPAAVAAACPPLTGPLALPNALVTYPSSNSYFPGYAWLTGVVPVDSIVMAALIVVCLFSVAYVLAACITGGRLSAYLHAMLRVFDINSDPMSISVDKHGTLHVQVNKVDIPMQIRPEGVGVGDPRLLQNVASQSRPMRVVKRPIGGVFFVFSMVTLFTLILTAIFNRAQDNVLSIQAANFLRPSDAAAALLLPFYRSPTWGSGVQLRITTQGNGDKCASLAGVEFRGFPQGSQNNWSITSTACGSGSSGPWQHVLHCPQCLFSSSSEVIVTLDYSCQSSYVEAGALDSAGALYTDSMGWLAGQGGQAFSTMRAFDGLYLSVVNDTQGPSTARGYALAPGATTQYASSPVLLYGQGAGLAAHYPSAQLSAAALAASSCGASACAGKYDPVSIPNVTLDFNLQLNTLYTINTLSQKITGVQLLNSIIGLFGVIGIFGSALRFIDMASEELKHRNVIKRSKVAGQAEGGPAV